MNSLSDHLYSCGSTFIHNRDAKVIGAVLSRADGLFDTHVAKVGKVGAFPSFGEAERAVRSGFLRKKAARAKNSRPAAR
jgi:hypothetical protein